VFICLVVGLVNCNLAGSATGKRCLTLHVSTYIPTKLEETGFNSLKCISVSLHCSLITCTLPSCHKVTTSELQLGDLCLSFLGMI